MNDGSGTGDLSGALAQFDRVEANLSKLEDVWKEIESRIPTGVVFGDEPTFDQLTQDFRTLAESLPAIGGLSIPEIPMTLDEIAHVRFDAMESGDPFIEMTVEKGIDAPGRAVRTYRSSFESVRRAVIRDEVDKVVSTIDSILEGVRLNDGIATWIDRDRWGDLTQAVSELTRLSGSMVPGNARWGDLRRHLRFAAPNDLSDIATMDWPSVKNEVQTHLYGDRDPMPIDVVDLADLVAARPKGPVSAAIEWFRLTDADFERLIFELVRQTDGYENANWKMSTNAADRGRDIEAHYVVSDPLSGPRRYRVIFQCKHWLSKSVGRNDLIMCVESVKLWEPPKIDRLVVATSGRFSQDAVELAEKRNHERGVPAVDLWAESHLEGLLAARPAIRSSFGLT